MLLETGEVVIGLASSGVKQSAILIHTILRERKKTASKVRPTNTLRSGKELEVFTVKDNDLQLSCQRAKKYGVPYHVLKDRDATDGLTDIMARAEDAGRINRVIEWFGLATVDMAQIRQEIERSRAERRAGALETPMAEPAAEVDTPQGPMTEWEMDGFLNAMLVPAPEGGATAPGRAQPDRDVDEPLEAARGTPSGREEDRTGSPTMGRAEKSRPSASTSRPKGADNPGISDPLERPHPSVRQALKEVRAERKQRAEEKTKENAG